MKKIEELLNDILIELKSINNSLNQEESDFGNPEIEDIKEIEDSLNQLCADYLLAVLRENQHNYDVNIFDLPFDSYVEYNNGFCYIVLYLFYDEIIYKFEEDVIKNCNLFKIEEVAINSLKEAQQKILESQLLESQLLKLSEPEEIEINSKTIDYLKKFKI